MPRRTTLVYGVLVLVRIFIAFTSTSLIHPDEHFQNPEIAAASVFNYADHGDGPLKTWEWTGDSPCRSILPVFGSSGLAFALSRFLVGPSLTARALFATERAVMLLFSFALDYLVHATSESRTTLLLLASSPVTFTFLLRPFSNSLETLAFAALISLVRRAGRKPSLRILGGIGLVLAIGVFIRITFVAFAAPAVFTLAWQLGFSTVTGAKFSPLGLIRRGLPIAFAFFASVLLFGFGDALHFNLPFNLTRLTPLNLLRYNLSSNNLAEHGLHPRYLHVVANWPMLFGVGLMVVWSARRAKEVKKVAAVESRPGRKLYIASFIVPTLLLSIQPHQEPRFLVPLIVPLALLAPHAPFLTSASPKARKQRRAFWVLWLLHTSLFTLLFGYLHQGGLLPALFALNDQLRTPTSYLGGKDAVNIVFWRTFMPPRHLLVPPTGGDFTPPAVRVTDLAGAPLPTLLETLARSFSLSSSSSPDSPATLPSSASLLVAPAYAIDPFALTCETTAEEEEEGVKDKNVAFCLAPLFEGRSFGVHVDMDRLKEMVGAKGWARVGVGVWEVVERTRGWE
ncbi:hypothetical protein JCM11251_006574 [Rhodosporidiobolus azoricus]